MSIVLLMSTMSLRKVHENFTIIFHFYGHSQRKKITRTAQENHSNEHQHSKTGTSSSRLSREIEEFDVEKRDLRTKLEDSPSMMSSGVVENEDKNNDGVMNKSASSSKRSRNEAEHAIRKDMRLVLDNAPTLAKEEQDDIKSATMSMLLQADRDRGKRVLGSNKKTRLRRMSRDQKANLGTVVVEIPLSPSSSPREGLSRGGM